MGDANEIKKLKEEFENKKNEYELMIKKLNEEINNERIENDKKLKKLNDDNTSLSKCLADKNREIQLLQNSNKLKINEMNKLKLIVKNNEKQLKVKKLKAEQQKENSPNNIKIKDLLKSNSRHINNNNIPNNNCQNIPEKNENKEEIISKLESEISRLKEELSKNKEEKENLDANISILEKDISDKINENEILENELINKNNKIEDENKIIGELKLEKDRLLTKLKEYKNNEDLNLSQIKVLKNHIKEIERQQNIESENADNKSLKKKELKKKIQDLELENSNIKMQLNYELKFNCQLNNEVKNKNEEIEGLKIFLNKLMAEKESNAINKNNFHGDSKDTDNSNNINRSKTKEELKCSVIKKVSNKDVDIKNSSNNEIHMENNKVKTFKRHNNVYQKENKTDKKLRTYDMDENENEISQKKNEATKSEDAKIEFMNRKK